MAVGSGAAGKVIVAVLIKSGKAHHIIAHRTNTDTVSIKNVKTIALPAAPLPTAMIL